MPDMTQKLITWTRVEADKSLSVYYPKTVASQVFLDQAGHTLTDHVQNMNAHLTAVERGRLNATGGANGYALLDAHGFVPAANINPAVLAVTAELGTLKDLVDTTKTTAIEQGQLVWVNNAATVAAEDNDGTALDAGVSSGWAIFRKRVGVGIDYSLLSSWTKVSEAESLDVVLDWANIQNKPLSTVSDIDDAVAKRHTHNNLDTVLENFVDASTATTTYVAATGTFVAGTTYYTDSTGSTEVDTSAFEAGVTDVSSYFVAQTSTTAVGLTYKGQAVAFNSEVSHIALASSDAEATTKAATMNENDIILVVSNANFTLPASSATEYTIEP